MPSSNLQFDDLTGDEQEKTNKINDIFQQVEDAMVEYETINMPNSNVTMSDAQFNRNQFFNITTTTFTADRTLTLPSRRKLLCIRSNDTSIYRIVVSCGAGGNEYIYKGQTQLIYADGSACSRVGTGGGFLDVSGTVGFASGNWSNVGSPWHNAEFARKTNTAHKVLRGVIVNTIDTPPVNIFTLPATGYAPTNDTEHLVRTSAGYAVIRIDASTRIVSVQSGTISTRLHLDGIVY